MKTWLLTWNPEFTHWRPSPTARRIQRGKIVPSGWSCGHNKSIQPGDRLFAIRLGREPRGIIGAGWATSTPTKGAAWIGKPNKKSALYVDLIWDSLLTESQNPFPISRLLQGKLAGMHWSSQASGVSIPSDIVATLEQVWQDHYEKTCHMNAVDIPDFGAHLVTEDNAVLLSEGEQTRRWITHYKREQRNRLAKLAEAYRKGRIVCEVPGCGFDFQKTYGDLGVGFAEVHHKRPVHKSGPRVPLLKDLAIVCANCHRMIHRGGQCRSLKKLIPSRG